MPKPLSRCTPKEAKAVLDSLPPRATMRELHRALVARGTPVSPKTLHNWKKSKWQRKDAASPLQAGLLRGARDAAERLGLPANALSGLSDGELVAHDMRALLIHAALLLGMVQHDVPRLMRENPRGLAAVMMAARRLIEGGNGLMRETREMAERSMRERLVLPPAPCDAHRGAHRDGDRDSRRADTDRQPLTDLLARFGALKQSSEAVN